MAPPKKYRGQERTKGREIENELFRRLGQRCKLAAPLQGAGAQRHVRERGSRVISDIKHEIACRIVRKSRCRNPSTLAEAKSLKRRAVFGSGIRFIGVDTHQRRKNRQFNPILLRSARSLPGLSIDLRRNDRTHGEMNPARFFVLRAVNDQRRNYRWRKKHIRTFSFRKWENMNMEERFELRSEKHTRIYRDCDSFLFTRMRLK